MVRWDFRKRCRKYPFLKQFKKNENNFQAEAFIQCFMDQAKVYSNESSTSSSLNLVLMHRNMFLNEI